MAKYVNKQKHESSNVITITTPSTFGSHKSMVVKDLGNNRVICKDDTHEYETDKNRLDNGLADPNRYA